MCHYGLNKVPTLPDSTLATLAVWTHKNILDSTQSDFIGFSYEILQVQVQLAETSEETNLSPSTRWRRRSMCPGKGNKNIGILHATKIATKATVRTSQMRKRSYLSTSRKKRTARPACEMS